MIRALAARPDLGDCVDRVTLAYDQRHRRRLAMKTDGGLEFLLDLAKTVELREGDALLLEDGRAILVCAAAEAVADLAADGPEALARLAWHLGNRHTPTQLFADRLRIRRDHVLEDMAERLGARVARLSAPFQPESGAYAENHAHGHGHGRDHAHARDGAA